MPAGNLFHFVTSDKDGAVYLATVVRLLRLCFQTAIWRSHAANSTRREAHEVEQAFTAHCNEYYAQQSAMLECNASFEGQDVVRVVQLTRVLTEHVGGLRTYSRYRRGRALLLGYANGVGSAAFEALGLEPVFIAMDAWDDLLLAEVKVRSPIDCHSMLAMRILCDDGSWYSHLMPWHAQAVIQAWSGSHSTSVDEDEEITKYGIVFELYFIVRQMSKSLEDYLEDEQLEKVWFGCSLLLAMSAEHACMHGRLN